MTNFEKYLIKTIYTKFGKDNIFYKEDKRAFNFKCCICGDSHKSEHKKRGWLYLDRATPLYHCYNECGTMSAETFLKKAFNIDSSEYKKEYYTFKNKEEVIEKKQENKLIEEFQVDKSWKQITDNYQILNYVKKRKILEAPYTPKDWKLYYIDGKFDSKRIIIPWIIDDKMKYWQSRQFAKDNSPRYLFPKNSQKPIFGIDRLDSNFPYIFLLEGIFNTIFVKNGVCLGSCSMTELQRDILRKYKDNYTIVWMLDNTTIDKTSSDKFLKLINNNNEFNNYFVWPKEVKVKDPNDYVQENTCNIFSDENFLKSNVCGQDKAKVKLLFKKF